MHVHMLCEVELELSPELKARMISKSTSATSESDSFPMSIPLWHLTRHSGYSFEHPAAWAEKLGPIIRTVCKVYGWGRSAAALLGYPLPDLSRLAPEECSGLLIKCAHMAFDANPETPPLISESASSSTYAKTVNLSGSEFDGRVTLRSGGKNTPIRLEEF